MTTADYKRAAASLRHDRAVLPILQFLERTRDRYDPPGIVTPPQSPAVYAEVTALGARVIANHDYWFITW